jgi:hypothetical protein
MHGASIATAVTMVFRFMAEETSLLSNQIMRKIFRRAPRLTTHRIEARSIFKTADTVPKIGITRELVEECLACGHESNGFGFGFCISQMRSTVLFWTAGGCSRPISQKRLMLTPSTAHESNIEKAVQ